MRKRAPQHPFEDNPFHEDFAEWMDSPEGQVSMEVSDAVWELLDSAGIDAAKRQITWEDGAALDIDQSLERIGNAHPDFPRPLIETHLLAWLEEGFAPQDYSAQQMEQFEKRVERWINDYQRQHQRGRGG